MTWRDGIREDFLRRRDKPEGGQLLREGVETLSDLGSLFMLCQLSKGLRALVTQVGRYREES